MKTTQRITVTLLTIFLIIPCAKANDGTITLADFLSLYDEMHTALTDASVSEPDLNLLRFMRQQRYSGITWSIACGTASSETSTVLASYTTTVSQLGNKNMVLPGGDLLDCIHFVANLNGYLSGTGDLTGWAGDLVEFSPGYASKTFPSGNFSINDLNADLDAYNVFHSTGTTIREKLQDYYITYKNYQRREALFVTEKSIYERFISSDNYYLLQILMNQKGTNLANIEGAAAMVDSYLATRTSITDVVADADDVTVYQLNGTLAGKRSQLHHFQAGVYIIGRKKTVCH